MRIKDIELLIVDHSENFANEARSYLKRMPGITVVGFCSTGEETLTFIMENHPDVVLLELIIRGLDGISVLRVLSGMHAPPLVIVCTEFFSDVNIRRAQHYGASYFLCKPISHQSLYSTITESVGFIGNSLTREEQSLNEQDDLPLIASFLIESGIPQRSIGYRYLCDAALLSHQNPAALLQVTKVLYPEIARLNAATPARVERDIRTAIMHAYHHSNLTINGTRPTNLEFIKLLTDRTNVSA